MELRFRATMLVAKLAMAGMELLGRKATYLPGKIAVKLCPDFMGHIEKPKTIVGVTGTNGKTTVCNMLIDALEGDGRRVLCNRLGSNVNSGIASSLIKGSTLSGRAKYDLAVFEIDERSAPLIYPYVKPTYLVCLDLFRDSIKRNAHPEFISEILTKYIPEESQLILPSEDLIASNIAPSNARIYFGIERQPEDVDSCINRINDARVCPVCQSELKYDFVRYHHIGRAHCPYCGFKTPEPEYSVTKIDRENRLMTVKDDMGEYSYHIIGDSTFNIFNELAAITVLTKLDLSREAIAAQMGKLNIVDTRFRKETIGDTEFIMHLAKGQNPVACSRACDYVRTLDGEKQVIMIPDDIHDAKSSTENLSWIYETDYDFLNDDSIKRIIVGGVRSKDYLLKLLLCGIPKEKIFITDRESDTPSLVDYSIRGGKIVLLYDLTACDKAASIRNTIKENIEGAAK